MHGNISWNGYGNAMIGSMVAILRNIIKRLMCNRVYHVTGFGCTGESWTDPQGEIGLCTVPKRLAKYEQVRLCMSMVSHQS